WQRRQVPEGLRRVGWRLPKSRPQALKRKFGTRALPGRNGLTSRGLRISGVPGAEALGYFREPLRGGSCVQIQLSASAMEGTALGRRKQVAWVLRFAQDDKGVLD